jgi:EAL domain-containing protein (putative c-di-GMP-specific phosphodiesterase class I)/AmiR/NasT family two-component response regulator
MLSRFSDARVVVIDDTVANVELLDMVLRRIGIRHIHTLTDPREAMAVIERVDPDLILLDLHMPHLDGFTLLAEIVGHAAGTYQPVLVLTADTTTEASHRALSIGAKDFLTKPFDITEVQLRVGNLLETRDLHQQLRRVSSSLAGELRDLRRQEDQDTTARELRLEVIKSALMPGAMTMVFQPIIELAAGRTVGYEALARFALEPQRTPDRWFADAATVGLGHTLELSAVAKALDDLPLLPLDAFMAINVSPEVIMRPELLDLITPEIAPRIVLELTEHHPVEDYAPVIDALDRLRHRGARLGVDDTGAGFASLRHILALEPDVIKLDLSLVRDVDQDPARRALAGALVAFAAETGTHLVAEGVETAEELGTLIGLGVGWAQGYHLGRPADPSVTPKPLLATKTR